MPAEHEPDQVDQWLTEQVQPLPPPPGTFELITRRARRRKVRRALISAASAAAVAAAVAVAVPVGLSLHLNPATSASLSSGSSAVKAGQAPQPAANGPGRTVPGRSSTTSPPARTQSVSAAPTASGTAGGSLSAPGSLPADFTPSSVTWDSLSSGWVIGQAGTAGHCANANPDICTSIAHTSDGGQTWSGLPAPSTGGPESATGVTGLRFLNATYGWAFGPELWATGSGGQSWHQVSTGGSAVTDLETAGQRAYALFGQCAPPAGSSGDTIANCTSYTLMTAVAGSDSWTAVSGIPAKLAPGAGRAGSAQLVLAASTGYLTGPDGTLYAGPLDGGAWHTMSTLPCQPGAAASDGLPGNVMLAAAGTTASSQTRLALACASATPLAGTVVYWSDDGGTTWVRQASAGTGGTAYIGSAQSLAATSDGTLILATVGSGKASGGIYYLSPGGSQWRTAALSTATGTTDGFSYVGMTSSKQGVALGGRPGLHAIWMTTDGGQTWQVRPVTS